MKKIEELLNKTGIAFQPAHKEKLVKTQPGDHVLLRGKTPTKVYLIIKLALVDLSDKLNKGNCKGKGRLFGEAAAAEKDDDFAKKIKEKVQKKIESKKTLTEAFGITSQANTAIARGVHDGIVRELLEAMYPFSAQIRAIPDPLQRQGYKQAYKYLRESMIAEIRKLGVFNV